MLPLLRKAVARLKPPPLSSNAVGDHTLREFEVCIRVLVRVDILSKPLQSPYEGPVKVLDRGEYAFSLDVGGKSKRISLDRLKPCFQEADSTGRK